ncbi:transcription termination factor MTERF2, chloroplastic-like [Pistacia vera]|uniref:transcription termination factor MTERF2, chloroplastic-like n=1 Tax=Pistacia vera TaxID=55513 RepID=UPI001263106F|nr:transcription termination factor MTERF2, chloroplastic-like [Pistacia vera]
MSSESALKASKKVQFVTPEKPDLLVNVLKSSGFSETQISDLIRKRPNLLLCNPEKTLLPKLEFFHSKGVSSLVLAKLLCRDPSILQTSLNKKLIPSFHYLSNLLQSSEKAITAVKRSPSIICHDLQKLIAPKVGYLRDNGVPESNIFRLLSNWTCIFINDFSRFKETVDLVKKMGINPARSQFVIAIHIMMAISKSLWDKKIDVYKRWGWSEEEILTAFRKNPWCMTTSVDKIMGVMDHFVNKMGWEPSVILKQSNLLSLSLEKRIVPRGSVLQYLSSKGLLKNNFLSATPYTIREETFLQKFVNCYDEAPQLKKLYKEKLDLSKKRD